MNESEMLADSIGSTFYYHHKLSKNKYFVQKYSINGRAIIKTQFWIEKIYVKFKVECRRCGDLWFQK